VSESLETGCDSQSPALLVEAEGPLQGDYRVGVAFDGDIGCGWVNGEARHCGGKLATA
jgi:hypothetical protein